MRGLTALSCLLTAASLFVNLSPASTSLCCSGEQDRRTNCSFQYTDGRQNKETANCQVKYGPKRWYGYDGCPAYAYESENDIPAGVVNLQTSFFYTSCAATILPSYPLRASACQLACPDSGGDHYLGLNITFQLEPFTAEFVEHIEISLHLHDGTFHPWCRWIDLGVNGIAKSAAEQHTFYLEGFVGLKPSKQYTLHVKTLPTDIDQTNLVKQVITAPRETCWMPRMIEHTTQFALNLTLLRDEEYNFTSFAVILINPAKIGTYFRKSVDFTRTQLYEINGAWGTDVFFDCLEPGTYRLVVQVSSSECPYCARKYTDVTIAAIPPAVSNCPADITRVVELSPAENVSNITWSEPVFNFSCGAQEDSFNPNRSHDPSEAVFRINHTTRVSYMAWQYDKVVECSFTVKVISVDTTPPVLTRCPSDITRVADAGAESMNVMWEWPQATDLSPVRFVPNIHNGSSFPVGNNTTVQYKIVDAFDNANDDCVFHVFIEGTPVAGPLTIILSCVIGMCLFLLLGIIIYCAKYLNRSELPELRKNNYPASEWGPVDENCIPRSRIGSKLCVDEDYPKFACHHSNDPPQRTASLPLLQSSWHRNDFHGDSRHGPSQLENVRENQFERAESVGSSHSSQFTGSYVDSPVSLESTI